MGKRAQKKDGLSRQKLAALIAKNPAVLEVLDRHGVTFCAGCFLTLSSPLEKAASYHAVPDLARFKKDLERALKRK